MKRYVLFVFLLCISLLVVNLTAKDSPPQYKAVELKHFEKVPGLDLSQDFVNYFYEALRAELLKIKVAEQVVDEGATVSGVDAIETVVVEGKFTDFTKAKFMPGSLSLQIDLCRRSDHRLITTLTPKVFYKGSPFNKDKNVAKFTGERTAYEIKKTVKNAPALASLPPSAPAAPSAPVATSAPSMRLGIQVRALLDDETQKLNLGAGQGVFVMKVDKDSLADTMQMQTGDIIIEVNGTKVAGVDQLKQLLGANPSSTVKVWRNGEVQQLAVPQSL